MPNKSEIKCHTRWLELTNKTVTGAWTEQEDTKLRNLVNQFGQNWRKIAVSFPGRLKQQCRDRWFNILNPNICKTEWTDNEDAQIVKLHCIFGNKWAQIA